MPPSSADPVRNPLLSGRTYSRPTVSTWKIVVGVIAALACAVALSGLETPQYAGLQQFANVVTKPIVRSTFATRPAAPGWRVPSNPKVESQLNVHSNGPMVRSRLPHTQLVQGTPNEQPLSGPATSDGTPRRADPWWKVLSWYHGVILVLSTLVVMAIGLFGHIRPRTSVSHMGATDPNRMACAAVVHLDWSKNPSDIAKEFIDCNQVVMFSKTYCPYCTKAKKAFDKVGIPYSVLELDELGDDGQKIQTALANITGQSTVPNVFINGRHLGGCDDTLQALDNGKVDIMLDSPRISMMNMASTFEDEGADPIWECRQFIYENKVAIFSKSYCPYCTEVKQSFEQKGVEFAAIELDKMGNQGQAMQNALAGVTGQGTVPNIFINGMHLGGCSDTKKAMTNGKVDEMLAADRVSMFAMQGMEDMETSDIGVHDDMRVFINGKSLGSCDDAVTAIQSGQLDDVFLPSHGAVQATRGQESKGSPLPRVASFAINGKVMSASAASKPAIMVNGASGKMGHAVAEAVLAAGLELVPFAFMGTSKAVAITNPVDDKVMGVDGIIAEGKLAKMKEIKEKYPNLIVVDYTTPTTVVPNVEIYTQLGLNYVCGTTSGDADKMLSMTEESGVYAVIAPQMGKQIVAFQAMVENLAARFPGAFDGYKLEVVESHQKTKVDTSGTAKAIVAAMDGLGCEPFNVQRDIKKIRNDEEALDFGVPFDALHGHAFHTYCLTSPDGSVNIALTHNVIGRSVYAEGTVDACLFLAQQVAAGADKKIYNMVDVLEGGFMR